MKCLVVLENHFFLDSNGKVWCDRVVDYHYLKRYLAVFDRIVVTGRTQIVDKIDDNKLLVTGKNIEFVAMPDFKGAKGLVLNLFKLKRIVRQEIKKCDCAIYRAPTHLSLFTYREILKAHKTLALEFMMAADKMFDGDSFIKRVLNKLVDKKAQKMCLKADGVSYVTEKILQKKYPCQAIINPKDKSFFAENYSSIDLEKNMYYKQKWDINYKPECFNIIHVGYMDSYRKGQNVLLEAVKKISDKGYSVKLTLIGDGEKKEEFEQLAIKLGIDALVHFTGMLKNKSDILNYLRQSHLFVFPTQSEGLPRTIIEAMSQSLPCISSPVDGIPELLDEEFLIDYKDVDGYANKIIDLMNNWNKCCFESEKNYQKALKYCKRNLDEKRKKFYALIVQKSVRNLRRH